MKRYTIILIALIICLATTGATPALNSEIRVTDSEFTPVVDSESPSVVNSESTTSNSEFEPSGTMYGIGSVSKVFTAAAVMRLVETGLIDLDEPVVTYIPDFEMADPRYIYITPRMLLDHSSGLMGSVGKDAFLLGDNSTYHLDSYLERLRSQRLKHDPGERSIYCNDGFTIAEILVERVSGVSFTEFIEREFSAPLGLENIMTPQSDFDRNRLADIYLGDNELKPQFVGAIGSGGIFATMEDLCRFATIFMDSADGSVLSRQSVEEMALNQHRMNMAPPGADTVFNYGLGWDSVDTYPFNQFGIQALSKGGSTVSYHTNLTVLPEHNIAAAVSTSGGNGGIEHIIAQEIILAVLIEEGLLPPDAAPTLPELNLERALIPESVKTNAGIYDTGFLGEMLQVDFTDYTLILTPFASHNERPQEFLYNTDGVFVSIDGNFIGGFPGLESAYGISMITFEGDYLVAQTYLDVPGLGQTAMLLPIAEKLAENQVSADALAAWGARNDKEYLLVSEKHSSMNYIISPIAKTLTDDRAPGYVTMGVYQGGGAPFPTAKIVDANNAVAFLTAPTMTGRDGVDLSVSVVNGVEYLDSNNGDMVFMDAAFAKNFSELGDAVRIDSEAIWVDIDAGFGGRIIYINAPQNGAWFVYDERMNCIATSLEMHPRNLIILPENGRLAFVGEPGAEFSLVIS